MNVEDRERLSLDDIRAARSEGERLWREGSALLKWFAAGHWAAVMGDARPCPRADVGPEGRAAWETGWDAAQPPPGAWREAINAADRRHSR